jgi:hypothetical protein
VNREAELDRPSRVACSDLLGHSFVFVIMLTVIYLQSTDGSLVPLKMLSLNGPAERHFQTPSSLCHQTVEYDTA